MVRFSGVSIATVTPFISNFAVNFDKAAQHTSWLIDSGVNDIIVTGSCGNFALPTRARRRQVICRLADQCRRLGALVVALRLSCRHVPHWVSLTCDLGIVGRMARSPALYRLTWTEVMQPNRALNSHGLPIILHNNPNDTVVNIAPEDLAKLFRVFPNVAAVQGFSAGARRIFSIGKCKDVQPPARTDDLHVENMLASAPGRSAATANPIAKKYVHLTTLTANALLIKSDRCTADFCRFCYDSPPQRVQPDQYGLAQIGRPADVKRPLSKRWTTRGSLSFEALDGFLSHGHDIV